MLLLIDGSAILVRSYHAHSDLTRSDGLPVGGLYGFCNTLWGIRHQKPTHAIVTFDHSRKCFRNDIYPAYKANRTVREAELAFQLTTARDAVRAFGIPSVEVEGFEADDIIATYTMQAVDRGIEVVIMSSDKDLMQLVCPTVTMRRPGRNGWEVCGIDYVTERFGIPPYLMGDLLALVGDASDNVPGVKGIGEKKAGHLLTRFGSLEGVIANAAEIPWPACRFAMQNSIESVRISRELVRLRQDVPLPVSIDEAEFAMPDKKGLLNFLHNMEFRALEAEVSAE